MTQQQTHHRVQRLTWLIVGLALVIAPVGPTMTRANAITKTVPSSTSASSPFAGWSTET